MIRKAAQRVWHRGWTANLSDTSNTKVTFPNSWKYHVSFWWLTAFSSLATDVFPSSRSPPDLQEIITLFTMAGRDQQRTYHSLVQVPQFPNSQRQTHTTGSWFLGTPSEECACLSLLHTGLSEEYLWLKRRGRSLEFNPRGLTHCRQVNSWGLRHRWTVLKFWFYIY